MNPAPQSNPSAAQLQTINSAAAENPKTLSTGREMLERLATAGQTLATRALLGRDIASAAKGSRIAAIAATRPLTLPQAVEQIAQVRAITASSPAPAVAAAPQSASTPRPAAKNISLKLAEFRTRRSASRAANLTPRAVAIPDASSSDSALFAHYKVLLGSERKAFLQKYADRLWSQMKREVARGR